MLERRKFPRPKTVLTAIEDITYSVLRSHQASAGETGKKKGQ